MLRISDGSLGGRIAADLWIVAAVRRLQVRRRIVRRLNRLIGLGRGLRREARMWRPSRRPNPDGRLLSGSVAGISGRLLRIPIGVAVGVAVVGRWAGDSCTVLRQRRTIRLAGWIGVAIGARLATRGRRRRSITVLGILRVRWLRISWMSVLRILSITILIVRRLSNRTAGIKILVMGSLRPRVGTTASQP
jgi:hypothetical protein